MGLSLHAGSLLRRGRAYALVLVACLVSATAAGAAEVTTEFNGLTLNGRLELAEDGRPKDEVVLIVHGFLAHNRAEIIETAQQALLDNGYSSLAINLSLGIDDRHGFHGCDRPHVHIQDDAVKEIAVWVDWLRSQGASRIVLLGHSSGANQAMVYAAENPDPKVTHVVLLAFGSAGTQRSRELYEQRYSVSFSELIASLQSAVDRGSGDKLIKIDWNSCPRAETTPRSFLSYYGDNNKFAQFRENLLESKVPALVIIGSLDELQPNRREILASPSADDRVQLRVIEGADHFFRDFNIDEAMEAAVEFLSE